MENASGAKLGGAALRSGAATGILLVMLGWESLSPRRPWTRPRLARRAGNIALGVINGALVRLALGGAAASAAAYAAGRGWGALALVEWPPWAEGAIAVAALDVAVYAQHVAFHKIPPLWRLHRVHHTDLDVDTTTGLRFHPAEILLSALYKCAFVIALGAPAGAVVAFEAILNGASLFNHGNVRISAGADRALRFAVVTPDMHRIHHSDLRRETDSNYGFSISAWDRLFGTYRAAPERGWDRTILGVEGFDAARVGFARLFVQPFLQPFRRAEK